MAFDDCCQTAASASLTGNSPKLKRQVYCVEYWCKTRMLICEPGAIELTISRRSRLSFIGCYTLDDHIAGLQSAARCRSVGIDVTNERPASLSPRFMAVANSGVMSCIETPR